MDSLIHDYRISADTDHVLRDKVIARYRSLVHSLAARFVTPRYTYEDVVEYAEYQLVEAVIAAKNTLTDDNIKPYLIKRIRCRLMDYVTFDHIITYPTVPDSRRRKMTTFKRRNVLVDTPVNNMDQTEIRDILEHCITSKRQWMIVNARLDGYTFKEIGVLLGLHYHTCENLFHKFQKSMENYREILCNMLSGTHVS